MDKMDFCAMRKGGLYMNGIACFVINHIVGFSTSSQVMSYAVYSDNVGCEGAVFKSSRQCHEKAEKLKG